MNWLTAPEIAATLPAAWLIATGARPANLPERAALRRATALQLLSRQLGLAADAILIAHEPQGRPVIREPAGLQLHISLATRDGVVALALANRPVGIDIERVEPLDPPPLAALHANERAALLALPEADRALAFARIWTAKEAYVKALGTGFLRPPESFCVAMISPERFAVSDPQRAGPATGLSTSIENGGQDRLAAAIIVLA